MPKTEYDKLLDLLETYKLILHPNIFDALIKQLFATNEENKRQAFVDAKISDDALLIEKKINELQSRFKQHPSQKSFFLKCFYKELIKTFLK